MSMAAQRLGSLVDLRRGVTWTSDRLAGEISRRAATLAAQGLSRGDRVLIAHGGSAAFFADLFAAWRCGAVVACANETMPPPELRSVVAFFAPRLVLVGPDATPPDLGAPVLDTTGAPDVAPRACEGAALDDPALVLFTSGTTGDPKGVVHTHRSLLARIALNHAHLGDAALRNTLCVLPTHFGHGLIGNCLTPLLSGQRLYLAPGVGLDGAVALPETLAAHDITFFSSVPALWKLVLRVATPRPLTALLRVGIGSAPLSADLWRDVVAWTGTTDVWNMYGITETANWIGGARFDAEAPRDGAVGRPWGGAFAVASDDGVLTSQGRGPLWVRTPSLMQGYLDRPDLTAEAVRDGWYCTGDVGEVDEAGHAVLTGRTKHEINVAGIKVHPEDLDLLLEQHDDVHEACAFGVPDAVSGECVAIAVRLADGAAIDGEGLRAWCHTRVRPDAVPRRWFLVDEIPKTDRGKIRRDQVRDACLESTP